MIIPPHSEPGLPPPGIFQKVGKSRWIAGRMGGGAPRGITPINMQSRREIEEDASHRRRRRDHFSAQKELERINDKKTRKKGRQLGAAIDEQVKSVGWVHTERRRPSVVERERIHEMHLAAKEAERRELTVAARAEFIRKEEMKRQREEARFEQIRAISDLHKFPNRTDKLVDWPHQAKGPRHVTGLLAANAVGHQKSAAHKKKLQPKRSVSCQSFQSHSRGPPGAHTLPTLHGKPGPRQPSPFGMTGVIRGFGHTKSSIFGSTGPLGGNHFGATGATLMPPVGDASFGGTRASLEGSSIWAPPPSGGAATWPKIAEAELAERASEVVKLQRVRDKRARAEKHAEIMARKAVEDGDSKGEEELNAKADEKLSRYDEDGNLRRTDCGNFVISDSNPVLDEITGEELDYKQIDAERMTGVLKAQRKYQRYLRATNMLKPGMPILEGQNGRNIDLTPVIIESGFEENFLAHIALEFHSMLPGEKKCKLEEILTLDHRKARLKYDEFKRCWYDGVEGRPKRFFCHEGTLKRVYGLCDTDGPHKGEITLTQMSNGLKYLSDEHPTAAKEVIKGKDGFFYQSVAKMMDLESTGVMSKLGMYALIEAAVPKEEVHLLCAGVWEKLTGGAMSLSTTEFIERLQDSLVMRQLWYNFMLLTTMAEGFNKKGEELSRKRLVLEEILFVTMKWRQTKLDGRFFRLDDALFDLRAAVEEKNINEIHNIVEFALQFTNRLRGADSLKASHYVKLMLGVRQAMTWSYVDTEFKRVECVIRDIAYRNDRSDEQKESTLERFNHLMNVIQAFQETGDPVLLAERKQNMKKHMQFESPGLKPTDVGKNTQHRGYSCLT